jgi:hypothetical protein
MVLFAGDMLNEQEGAWMDAGKTPGRSRRRGEANWDGGTGAGAAATAPSTTGRPIAAVQTPAMPLQRRRAH